MSAYKTKKYRVEGVAPLIMNNGQKCNPLNPLVKEIKKLTSKGRKKTDEDLAEICRLEWYGGLYVNDDKRVIIPGEVIEATIRNGARKTRRGKDVEMGLLCDQNPLLEYDGPKDIDKLWADERFRSMEPVNVQKAKVIRSRPKFPAWKLSFALQFRPDILNEADVDLFVQTAGDIVGFCDWRPKHGRFIVV